MPWSPEGIGWPPSGGRRGLADGALAGFGCDFGVAGRNRRRGDLGRGVHGDGGAAVRRTGGRHCLSSQIW